MGKITGLEHTSEVPAKVLQLYEAVVRLIEEGTDLNSISVANITEKAGIGKGTAYEYFDSKEEILVCALVFFVQQLYEVIDGLLNSDASFEGRIGLMLDLIDKGKGQQKDCYGARYLHIITDQSGIGKMVMEKLHEPKLSVCLPGAIFKRIIEEGIGNGEVREDIPTEYMVFTLLAEFTAYLMCSADKGPIRMEREKMRPYLMKSLAHELLVKTT